MRSIDASQLRPHLAKLDAEVVERFECFGGWCTVIVAPGPSGSAAASAAASVAGSAAAAASARESLLGWHTQFSRFVDDSELSRLNADTRGTVPVSALMARLVSAALAAAARTGGLVDPTLSDEIERAGYAGHFEGEGIPLSQALALAPPRVPATPRSDAVWRSVSVDLGAGTVTRPVGVKLDPGGIAKGLFADELAEHLAGRPAVVIDCAGDLRLAGVAGTVRPVHVESPFDGSTLHTFSLAGGGVATSGIGKRSWRQDGRPAHHLLDPGTGMPAYTGVVQVTALAPDAVTAEALSKAALLSGPDGAGRALVHGGVVVLDDGSHVVIGSG
ncbi:MAG: FAD:protein FMN transferase [Solirubrobacteraceae bacterium]